MAQKHRTNNKYVVKVMKSLGCIGTNMHILRGVALHDNFMDCAQQKMHHIHEAARHLDKPFTVSFVCTGGSHRSVACVELSARIAEIDQRLVAKIHMDSLARKLRAMLIA